MSRAGENSFVSVTVEHIHSAGHKASLTNPLIAKAHELCTNRSGLGDEQLKSELNLLLARMQIMLWAADRMFPIPNAVGTEPENPDAHRGALFLAYSYALVIGFMGVGRVGAATRDLAGMIMEEWLPFLDDAIRGFFNHLDPEARFKSDFEYYFSLSEEEQEKIDEYEDEKPLEEIVMIELGTRKIMISDCSTTDYERLLTFVAEIADMPAEHFAAIWQDRPSAAELIENAEAISKPVAKFMGGRVGEDAESWYLRAGLPSTMLWACAAMVAPPPFLATVPTAQLEKAIPLCRDVPSATKGIVLTHLLGARLHRGDWEREEDYQGA